MKRIVLADDSKTALIFIRRCLEIVGLRDACFIEARNGQEALDRLLEAPTDLLVMDLTMPKMDGPTLLRRVKANPRLTDIPVLVVSSNPTLAKTLPKDVVLAVLNKPLVPAELREALKPFLDSCET